MTQLHTSYTQKRVVTDRSTTLILKEAVLIDTHITFIAARFLVLQRVHDERISPIKGHAAVRARVFSVDSALCVGLLFLGCGLRVHVCIIIFHFFHRHAVQGVSLCFGLWNRPCLSRSDIRTLHWMLRWSPPLTLPWANLKYMFLFNVSIYDYFSL